MFCLPQCSNTYRGSCLSPVCRVPLLCPCIGDLLSVLHPEAFSVGGLSSGEVTKQGNGFAMFAMAARAVQWQDDLIRGIDLWFWKTETVKLYHRTEGQHCSNATSHAVVAVGYMLFLYNLCRRLTMKWGPKYTLQINKRHNKYMKQLGFLVSTIYL